MGGLQPSRRSRRAARDHGKLAGPAKKRSPTLQIPVPRDKKIAELGRETARGGGGRSGLKP